MARSFIGGMTDYSHQSFEDVLSDIDDAKRNAIAYIDAINKNINGLDNKENLWQQQPFDMKTIISYSLKTYNTVASECADIYNEIKNKRVEEHHSKRLFKLAEVCNKINQDIGKYWNNDYERHKDYENKDFRYIENIYADCRDAAVYFLDLSNIAVRLRDFVGKTADTDEQQKSTSSFHGARFGDNAVIVVGNNNIVSPSQVIKNDLSSLENLLKSNQVPQDDIEEIKDIIKNEQPDIQNNRLGSKVNGWIAKMVNKSLDGTWAIGIGAAGKLLADGIKHYYGLFQ